MKNIKFLLIAFVIMGISSFYACGSPKENEKNRDTTQVNSEPVVPEETPDTLAR